MALDDVDRRVLDELLRDGRAAYAELGREVGLSASAVAERVRRLEESGVITGYACEVDAEKLGLPIAALVRLRYPNANHRPHRRPRRGHDERRLLEPAATPVGAPGSGRQCGPGSGRAARNAPGPVTSAPEARTRSRSSRSAVTTSTRPDSPASPSTSATIALSPSAGACTTSSRGWVGRSSTFPAAPSRTRCTCSAAAAGSGPAVPAEAEDGAG